MNLFLKNRKVFFAIIAIFIPVALWIFYGIPRSWRGFSFPANTNIASAASTTPPWYNTNWKYRVALTIQNAYVASSSPTSTYNNFTVLLSSSSTAWKQASYSGGHVASSTGADILFTDSSGVNQLSHEIEQYVSSTGQLVAWIKMPSIATSSNTVFYMYYGNGNVTSSEQSVTSTWDSSYAAVYHFPNGTTLSAKDSTANAYNGTVVGATATTTPWMDGAAAFNGTNQVVSSTYFQASSTAATYEAWINVPSTVTTTDVIIQDRGPGSGHSLTLALDGNLACGSTSCGATLGTVVNPVGKLMFGDDSANIWIGTEASNTPSSNNAWHFVVGTFSAASGLAIASSEFNIYIDGSNTSTRTSGNTGTDNSPLTGLASTTFGYHPAWAAYYKGAIDEVRISNMLRSADWIKTEYNDEASPATFITIAAEQVVPTFYTETSYRWYKNANSSSTGALLTALQNTSATAPIQGTPFRLRMLIQATVSSSTPAIGSSTFELQYATSTPGGCTTSTGLTFTNMSTSTGNLRYYSNSGVVDGSLLTPSSTDPTNGVDTVVRETYDQSNPFITTSTIGIGQDGEWDFALVDTASPPATTYCVRAVHSDGTLLDAYSALPEIHTNATPSFGGVSLNNGQNITLSMSTTTLVQATSTVTDLNGYQDIASVSSTLYLSSVGQSCTADQNACYLQTSCTTSTCAGTSCLATCSYNVQYFADPTDSGSPWAGQSWIAAINAVNNEGATTTATSTGESLLSLLALQATPSVNYGSLSAGQVTNPVNQPMVVTSTGNVSLDATIYGTAMTAGSNSIPPGAQAYATSSINYASATQLLVNPGAAVNLNIKKTTSTANPATTTILWGISVPNPQPTGNYTGGNTVIGVENSLPWP